MSKEMTKDETGIIAKSEKWPYCERSQKSNQ